MGIRTGQQFLEGLKDSREIWLEGRRVEDVTTDPKLGRMAKTLARLFDLQHDSVLHDDMTFKSPTTGDPVTQTIIIQYKLKLSNRKYSPDENKQKHLSLIHNSETTRTERNT